LRKIVLSTDDMKKYIITAITKGNNKTKIGLLKGIMLTTDNDIVDDDKNIDKNASDKMID